jgi:acetoin utilization deacetylase AcuC-like enzyme
MQDFLIIYSDEFLLHETGSYHPEKPERLSAIVEALKQSPWCDRLQWQPPTPTKERKILPWLEKVHDRAYLELLFDLSAKGGGRLDADTPVSPQSYRVALLAASGWLDGVDRVIASNNPAFVLARPPGHHAESNRGMGFCLLSNAAIAANYALSLAGVERVAIFDWDVHHGNGTEAIVSNNPQIIYCSFHQSPAYPGTGKASDRGAYDNVLNLPMPPHSNFNDYQPIFVDRVLPFIRDFQPHLIIVSAGYDANWQDPLAEIALKPEDYGKFTAALLEIDRRILFGLEGGYHLEALAQSVIETIAPCLSFD